VSCRRWVGLRNSTQHSSVARSHLLNSKVEAVKVWSRSFADDSQDALATAESVLPASVRRVGGVAQLSFDSPTLWYVCELDSLLLDTEHCRRPTPARSLVYRVRPSRLCIKLSESRSRRVRPFIRPNRPLLLLPLSFRAAIIRFSKRSLSLSLSLFHTNRPVKS
jgi:hypothetical protein